MLHPTRMNKEVRGALLVEAVIGTGLLALLAGLAGMASNAVRGSYRAEFAFSELDGLASVAGEVVTERLRTIDVTSVLPAPAAGTFSNWINFQRVDIPGTLTPSPPESLLFEPEPSDPTDGIDNDGDGLVDEGRLVWILNPGQPGERRRILTGSVAANLEGELPGNLIDDNNNGLVDEPGVCFEFQSRRIIFHLTLEQRGTEGFTFTRTIQHTIAPRNTPEPEALP